MQNRGDDLSAAFAHAAVVVFIILGKSARCVRETAIFYITSQTGQHFITRRAAELTANSITALPECVCSSGAAIKAPLYFLQARPFAYKNKELHRNRVIREVYICKETSACTEQCTVRKQTHSLTRRCNCDKTDYIREKDSQNNSTAKRCGNSADTSPNSG